VGVDQADGERRGALRARDQSPRGSTETRSRRHWARTAAQPRPAAGAALRRSTRLSRRSAPDLLTTRRSPRNGCARSAPRSVTYVAKTISDDRVRELRPLYRKAPRA
jgi:hypothetical protein